MKKCTIGLVLLLSGCAFAPKEPYQAFDTAKLKAIPFLTLCDEYHNLVDAKLLTPNSQSQLEDVLVEMGLPKEDLAVIRKRQISIGMTQCGLYASWGKPRNENRSVSKYAVRIQHVYGYDISVRRYVYTKNGIVTSWQD